MLDDIDLHIRSGQTIGIVGGTGSAKTSLVQLIPRLYDVTAGTLTVGGVDVRDYELESLRDEVAMVLQKNVLFAGTIAENLRWGNPYATDEELRHACELAQADGFIQEFPDKYDTYIEQGGTNVSGGLRQRRCIARALIKKPMILILDDSTSAVDTKTDKLIREAFHHEIQNTTKIIISQRVASVEESDKIVVMHEGRILDQGTNAELLERCEEYRSIEESDKIVVMHEGRILDQGTNAELLERCEEYRSIYESQTQQHSQQDLDKESQDLHEEEAEASDFAIDYNEDMRTSDVIARQKEREREQQAHMAQDIEAIKGGEQR